MANGPKELRPLVVLAAMVAGTGVLLCLVSAMSNDRRMLATGTLCLLVGALAFLAWALTATSELRRRVRELAAERPELGDEEFVARFFPGREAGLETVSRVRRLLARRFAPLGGAAFWPDDRLVEDLHLPELAPADIADLPGALCRELRLPYDRWPEDAESGWRTVRDVYETALAAGEPPRPPAAPVQPA